MENAIAETKISMSMTPSYRTIDGLEQIVVPDTAGIGSKCSAIYNFDAKRGK